MDGVHVLKTWPEPFEAVAKGINRFEVRKDDRGFAVGDRLALREWIPREPPAVRGKRPEAVEWIGEYTGRVIMARVTYLLRGPAFGLPAEMVVMSLDVYSCVDLGMFEGAWESFFETYVKTRKSIVAGSPVKLPCKVQG